MNDDVTRRLQGLSARSDMPQDAKLDLAQAIGALSTPLQTDVWIYRGVVGALGLVAVTTVLGGIVLAGLSVGQTGAALPEGIVAIGSASVGALAGLLAPSPRGQS